MRTYLALISTLVLAAASAVAAVAPADSARPSSASLRAKHSEVAGRLAGSPFGKPLLLEASDDQQRVSGDAYAILDHAFARAAPVLSDPAQWCEILLLPFNTKSCEATGGANALALTVHVGRKYSTPLDKTYRIDFRFETPPPTADYMRTELTAPAGPFGTRDYRIVLEITPLDASHTFLHFGYSYAYGTLARAAMQTYLATIGANKVGFTKEGDELVRGMRGVMERNTMRYFLAIESYLRAQGVSAEKRPAKMVEDWFTSVQRYPRQLKELDHDEYVQMKMSEYDRMHAGVSRAPRTASSSPSPS